MKIFLSIAVCFLLLFASACTTDESSTRSSSGMSAKEGGNDRLPWAKPTTWEKSSTLHIEDLSYGDNSKQRRKWK